MAVIATVMRVFIITGFSSGKQCRFTRMLVRSAYGSRGYKAWMSSCAIKRFLDCKVYVGCPSWRSQREYIFIIEWLSMYYAIVMIRLPAGPENKSCVLR